ncbi:hypothetical protein ABZ778_33580 [Streptomyces bacillaris]|uniref:hypothetical protein n=1 Tax=Streptomyces bacillaris TaxID=68179 RepID=UPI00345FC8E6
MAAHEAVRLAGLAVIRANQSLQAAHRTRDEADGATREATMAQLQAAVAVQASASARSTAADIADPANTAIALTAPFSGTDVGADLAAEVAKAAIATGQAEVTKAEARAAEAVKAADAARAAADRANAQVAPAFKAAADAARSSADAARSSAAALKSAAQAAEDGAKACSAAARADQADAQVRADAALARRAAEQAFADAAAARTAATQAEVEAERARGAATRAENEAAAASSAAALAEREAATAQSAATQAEQEAADAGKLAESAEAHAKSAEEAAKNANAHAEEAKKAAERAEEAERERQRKELAEAAKKNPKYTDPQPGGEGGEPGSGAEALDALILRMATEYAQEQVGLSEEELALARDLSGQDLVDYLMDNGAEILVELFLADIKECIDDPDIGICIWAIVQNAGPVKLAKIGSKLPKIGKAIWGIKGFLEKVDKARKKVDAFTEKLEDAKEKLGRLGATCDRDSGGKPGKQSKASAVRRSAAPADDKPKPKPDTDCTFPIFRTPKTVDVAYEKLHGPNPARGGRRRGATARCTWASRASPRSTGGVALSPPGCTSTTWI